MRSTPAKNGNSSDPLASVLQEAAEWLAADGRPLWSAAEIGYERVLRDASTGLFHVARQDDQLVGVMRFELEDAHFWPEVLPGTSAFVHKLAPAERSSLPHATGTVPPSITYSTPVMEAARCDTRNSTSSATSCGLAGRPSGMPPREFMRERRAPS